MLSEQSTPKSKCVVWVDSKNDPEYIKYQNQYNLYLRGKLIVDYFKQNPNATNSELNLKEVELEKKYPVNIKFDGFGSEFYKPITGLYVGEGDARRWAPQYKKPTLHCIKPPTQTKQETPNVVTAVEPKKEIPNTKPFCNGGTLFRNQTYYPGYSPMLGNNWKVDVKGKANFGKSLPTQTNELVMVCKDQGIEKRFYFPLESDFQEFKQKQPMGKFDNTLYKYVNNGSSFPSDDFYKTLKLAGTKGQNVTTIQDGDVVKYWYHYSPIPLDGLGAREYFGVSSKEHLS